MPTMKSVQTAAPGTVQVTEIEHPVPGPRDVLVRVRACGICGTDAAFVQMGGMPQAAPSGIIGCGGALGAMREYLLIENAVAGTSVAVFPDTLPFEIAALNEPMAVARHCVNRSQAGPADKIVVFWRRSHRARRGDLAEAARSPARGRGRRPSWTPADGAGRRRGRGAQEARTYRSGRDAAQRDDHHRVPGLPHRDLRGHPGHNGVPGALRPADQPPRPLHRRRAGIPARAHPPAPPRRWS